MRKRLQLQCRQRVGHTIGATECERSDGRTRNITDVAVVFEVLQIETSRGQCWVGTERPKQCRAANGLPACGQIAIAQQTDSGIKQDTKDAAHSTGKAAKKTGHKIKKGTKKAVNKSADATRKGAEKVEDKSAPKPTPPPQK